MLKLFRMIVEVNFFSQKKIAGKQELYRFNPCFVKYDTEVGTRKYMIFSLIMWNELMPELW